MMDRRRDFDRKRTAEQPWRQWRGTQRWRRRSADHLTREPLCRMCQAQGLVTAATIADHVIPHRGDPALFWEGELQSLCKLHHDSAKQREERGKPRQVIGLDGWPV